MKRKFLLIFCLISLYAAVVWAAGLPSSARLHDALADSKFQPSYLTSAKDDLNIFYGQHGYRPVWDFSGDANRAALDAFLQSVSQAVEYHGLTASHYPLAQLRELARVNDDASALELELLVTATLLRLAHELHGDTVRLEYIYPGWNLYRENADIPMMLSQVVAGSDVNDLFLRLAPQAPAYRALARALRIYRALAEQGDFPKIAPGPMLKLGDRGPRVEQLRARLIAEKYIHKPNLKEKTDVFDEELVRGLKTYQQHNGLNADGQVGDETLMHLNTSLETRIDQIRANMERWRHMPEDYPLNRAVYVNIADALLDVVEDGKVSYRGPVIVGQVRRKTPFIHSEISRLVINPFWHVPAKIARLDILPKLREDPHYLEKLGIIIRDSDDDPYGAAIDWLNMADKEFNFRLRQEPGDQNSLGRLKFDFENPFAVYLHGTPHQELFDKSRRALSSGCVRLRDPEQIAQLLLASNEGEWDIPHIEAAIETTTTRIVPLERPMPLYVLYWTVFADDSGMIQFRPDVYKYDQVLIESMKDSLSTGKFNQRNRLESAAAE